MIKVFSCSPQTLAKDFFSVSLSFRSLYPSVVMPLSGIVNCVTWKNLFLTLLFNAISPLSVRVVYTELSGGGTEGKGRLIDTSNSWRFVEMLVDWNICWVTKNQVYGYTGTCPSSPRFVGDHGQG
jgi:hypothetical protein